MFAARNELSDLVKNRVYYPEFTADEPVIARLTAALAAAGMDPAEIIARAEKTARREMAR